jgi:hypothetical protein
MISVSFFRESCLVRSVLSNKSTTEADTGIALFGGYDTEKYVGDLISLDIQPDPQCGICKMNVAWTSLSITDPQGATELLVPDGFVRPANLDTGTSLTILPADLYDQIAQFVNVVPDPSWDGGYVDCELMRSSNFTLDFGFGGPDGPVISVWFSELVLPTTDENGQPLFFEGTDIAACRFGLFPQPEGFPLLFGDTFLRSAYVVYDLDGQKIYLAQTDPNSDKSNIVEIGSNAAPSASKHAGGITVSQTATGLLAPGFNGASGTATKLTAPPTVFGSISAVATSSASGPSAKPSKGTAAVLPVTPSGISLVVCLPLLSMVLGAAFVFFG